MCGLVHQLQWILIPGSGGQIRLWDVRKANSSLFLTSTTRRTTGGPTPCLTWST